MRSQLPIKAALFVTPILLVLLSFLPNRSSIQAQEGNASLYLSPTQGAFEVGSTFNVSVYVNTGGIDANAVKLDLAFPSDKLQVVSPSTGDSFITIWITQPKYSNVDGTLSFQGGLPSPGINTSAGLISTITFRAKSPGTAVLSVLDTSRVLANDGEGTDMLTAFGNAQYTFTMPSPEGPNIYSPSHPDKNKWYRDNNVTLHWELAEVALENGFVLDVTYSWGFDRDPKSHPDNKADGKKTSMYYEGVESGIWYFHVKANVGGQWGKTGHYPVRIDTDDPAEFTPIVQPQKGGPDIRRSVSFKTTDSLSGIDHYEVKIDSLTDDSYDTALFSEQQSPWIMPLLPEGEYTVTVRAYDKAGNWIDGEVTFSVRKDLYSAVHEYGIRFGSWFIPWWQVFLVLVTIVALIIAVRKLRKRITAPTSRLANILRKSKRSVKKERSEFEKTLAEKDAMKEIIEKELKTKQDEKQKPKDKTNNPKNSNSVNLLREEDGFPNKNNDTPL